MRPFDLKIILIAAIWFLTNPLYGQYEKKKIERISIEDGLTSKMVNSFFQDPEGFMWVCTRRGGLLRYDGIRFKEFEGFDSLNLESVQHYFQDSEGFRYISTEKNGLIMIDPDSGDYQEYKTNSVGEEFFLPSVFEDSHGNIWVLSYGQGLSFYNKTDGTLTSYLHDPDDPHSIPDNQLYEMVEDDQGFLWIGTENGGLAKFDPMTRKFKNYLNDPADPSSIPGNKTYGLRIDHLNRLWVSLYNKGLCSMDLSTEAFTFYAPSGEQGHLTSSHIWPIEIDDDRGLWIGTQKNGIDYLDFQTMLFTNFPHDPNDHLSPSGNRISSIYRDNESNIWFAPSDQGVNFYNRVKDVFQSIHYDPLMPNGISSNDIRYIEEDELGNLWISHAKDGVDYLESKTGKIIHFSAQNTSNYKLSSDNINFLMCDKNGFVWVGTMFGGLNRINIRTKEVKIYLPNSQEPNKGPYHSWIFNIMQSKSGDIWLSSNGALSKLDPKLGIFSHIIVDKDEGNKKTPAGGIVQSITEDSKGRIWLATEKGLEILDPESMTFSLTEYNFICWYIDGDEGWFSSKGQLSRFNFATEEIDHFPFEDHVIINDVVEDNNGVMWLACNDGIRSFDLVSGESRLLNTEDGLNSNLFIGGSLASPSTGRLYFNSQKGINTFHPDDVKIDTFLPKVKFTSLNYFDSKSSDNRPRYYKNILDAKQVVFPHYYNIITVEFAALSYKKPKKNKYQYRIQGLNSNWIDLGTERSITFTNLHPQEYNLEVKGSNGDGVWNDNPSRLKLIITPPWYATRWAYALYIISFIALVWKYIRSREKEQQRKLDEERKVVERLKEVDRLKDVFLANTSHELRTPLNGIIGISESLKDGIAGKMSSNAVHNLNMIINSGRRLAHLVNDILDFSKLKNKELTLRISPVDLRSVVDVVIALTNPLVGKKDLTITNEVPSDLPLLNADEDRLQQIIYNLIGNAIKFTHEGTVRVYAEVLGDQIVTTVSDSGIGIPEDKMNAIFQSFDQVDSSIEREYGGTGLGLTITKQLVESHGGEISVDSEVGKGTNVRFSLPVSKEPRSEYNEEILTESISSQILDLNQEDEKEIPILVENDHKEHSSGINILIVDDEPVNRQVLTNYLQLEGYDADIAEDGESALQKIKQTSYNLILLDVMMPRMSGYQVAREIRKTHLPSVMPIIMLTAKNGIDDLVAGFNSGANDYLAKPFVRKELISRIKNHLNLQKIVKTSSQFVPDAFIKSVGKESITEVELGDYAEKVVTVMFTDIRNYTGLSEKMSPRDNFEFVRSYVGKMGPIIQENKGFVNQYLGDGLMCIFDQGYESALNGAIEMQLAIEEYNKRRLNRKRPPIQVGMGLSTGPLIMGIIGDELRKDPTTISSTVNLASRIEGLTKATGAKILMNKSEHCRYIDHEKFCIRSLGIVRVRGQEETFELLESFASDSNDVKEKKWMTIGQLDEAIHTFHSGASVESISLMKEIIALNPDDKTAQFLLKYFSDPTIHALSDGPVGIIDFTSK